MSAALAGVDAVIHSAGIAHAMSGVPQDDYRVLNTEATIGARPRRRAGARQALRVPVLDPRPERTDGGGRPHGSARAAADRCLRALQARRRARPRRARHRLGRAAPGARLRPRRQGQHGGAAAPRALALSVAARRPRRPSARCSASTTSSRRSTPCSRAPEPLRRPLIVADPEPLTVADMIAAMREGLGRRPGLFPVPAALMEAAFRAMGRAEAFERLAGSLVASPAALRQLGWVPPAETRAGLAALARNPGGDG